MLLEQWAVVELSPGRWHLCSAFTYPTRADALGALDEHLRAVRPVARRSLFRVVRLELEA